jgi:hypothetical protein
LDSGKHHIQNNQGIFTGKRTIQTLHTVVNRIYVKSFRDKVLGDQLTQLGVIVHHQNPWTLPFRGFFYFNRIDHWILHSFARAIPAVILPHPAANRSAERQPIRTTR